MSFLEKTFEEYKKESSAVPFMLYLAKIKDKNK